MNKSLSPSHEEILAGASTFTRFFLYVYDPFVMYFANQYIWKCPTKKTINFINAHISDHHLDVGVGTGFFLDHCIFPDKNPTLHLMDLNPTPLNKAAHRLKRFNPVCHTSNVLEPINIELPKFKSISMNNVLHCMPGTLFYKERALANLLPFLDSSGIFFGMTILGKNIENGFPYRLFNSYLNRRAIFCNNEDGCSELESILRNIFADYSLELEGSVALFSGRL